MGSGAKMHEFMLAPIPYELEPFGHWSYPYSLLGDPRYSPPWGFLCAARRIPPRKHAAAIDHGISAERRAAGGATMATALPAQATLAFSTSRNLWGAPR